MKTLTLEESLDVITKGKALYFDNREATIELTYGQDRDNCGLTYLRIKSVFKNRSKRDGLKEFYFCKDQLAEYLSQFFNETINAAYPDNSPLRLTK